MIKHFMHANLQPCPRTALLGETAAASPLASYQPRVLGVSGPENGSGKWRCSGLSPARFAISEGARNKNLSYLIHRRIRRTSAEPHCAAIKGKPILTVSKLENSAMRGVLSYENGRRKGSSREVHLSLNSNLLRL